MSRDLSSPEPLNQYTAMITLCSVKGQILLLELVCRNTLNDGVYHNAILLHGLLNSVSNKETNISTVDSSGIFFIIRTICLVYPFCQMFLFQSFNKKNKKRHTALKICL